MDCRYFRRELPGGSGTSYLAVSRRLDELRIVLRSRLLRPLCGVVTASNDRLRRMQEMMLFSSGPSMLQVHDLGLMPYDAALELQRRLQREVIGARLTNGLNSPAASCRSMHRRARGPAEAGHLLLVEHDPPVITITRRPAARNHLVATEAQLRHAGVELAETDRGGDITYHGPGQLVAYPILDLSVLDLRLGSYMRWLEQIVIDVLGSFGIEGVRDPAAPGVWVQSSTNAHGWQSASVPGTSKSATAKICAMGVRISRWVSMHGLALNVNTNLQHFDLIVPCGLQGRIVTSLQRELGSSCPAMHEVKARLVDQFQRAARLRCPA